MEVKTKYQLISRSSISSISLNPHHNLLALVAPGNDTTNLFSITKTHPQPSQSQPHPQPQIVLVPRFTGESKPSSSAIVSWSPNGAYIAVANVRVQLWKFEGTRMAPVRIVSEGFVEIKGLDWLPDSSAYMCYGITPKDTPLTINIRNIQSNQLRQIVTQDPPILASFDPFGKYIAVLMLKNVLDLYDSHTLEKIRSINLAQGKNDIPTLRDRRMADWSPQYGYFACPNLNDSRIPTSLIFDRNRNFTTKQILVGHQASISCLKFNPHIYEYQSDITFILAVGDSSGCLSLWRIGKNKSYKQPLFIASSPINAEESIEGLEWDREGEVLLVNVLKKYLGIYWVRGEGFGRRLGETERAAIIVGTYGATGVNQITSTKLEIFGGNQLSFQKGQVQQTVQHPKISYQTDFQHKALQPQFNYNLNSIGTSVNPQIIDRPKQKMIITQQQTIYNKDSNSNNPPKKRIIPSRIIPQSSLPAQPPALQGSVPSLPLLTHQPQSQSQSQNTTIIIQKSKSLNLRLPVLKQQLKKEYYLDNDDILQVEVVKNCSVFGIRARGGGQGQVVGAKRVFYGDVRVLAIGRDSIYVSNNAKLHILDFDLKLIELPCYIGEISNFAVNNTGTVYYMNTNGNIRGFNYLRHEFIVQTSIQYLFMSTDPNELNFTVNPLILFSVFDDDCDRLHVQLKSNMYRYFFCKQTNCWTQFLLQQGFYQAGHSLRITPQQSQSSHTFYTTLIAPALALSLPAPNSQTPSVSPYQLQLIYYRKYVKDIHKFKDALLRLIADLKMREQDDELRKIIVKYFGDRGSECYIADQDVWAKVRGIGGRVVEEFIMLGGLGG